MKALILAAGYATRLYPLTKEYPKPLLELNQRPIIDYIIDKLRAIRQIDEVFVISNSRFFSRFVEWSKGLRINKKITLIDDLTRTNRSRLGAIGDINFAIRKARIRDDLLVIGGDNLFSQPLEGFVEFSLKRRPHASVGVYKLKNKSDASRYGVVRLDRKRIISDFCEKPEKPATGLVAMCLYFIPQGSLGLIKEYVLNGPKLTDTTGGYIAWLKERSDVYGFIFRGRWFDIGDYKYLKAAKFNFAHI